MFKNTALANFHAEKSGHDQFEESTEAVSTSCVINLFRLVDLVECLIDPPPRRVDQAAHGGRKDSETC